MATTDTFQITPEQAENYEERFVPALFANWVDAVLGAADVHAGQHLLDVACGTGIVTRHAADAVGASGHVTGLDLNPAMLAVASRIRPDVTWRQGDAVALPFDDDAFDVVTCQAGVMFFPDVVGALRELGRVTRPGGTVAVQAFGSREQQPVYGPWIAMVARHAGEDALRLLGTYWAYGDRDAMRERCVTAGLRVRAVHDHERPAYFPSVEAMVLTELNATPLGERLTPAQQEKILTESRDVLAPFVDPDGQRLTVPMTGYVLTATPA